MQKNSAGRTGLVRIGAGIAVVALSLSACSSSKKPATVTPPAKGVSANDVNKGTATPGGKAVYDMEKQIDDFNILDADGSTDVSANFFNALLPSAYVAMPDYSVAMNKDLLVSGDLTSSKPETLVYKINPKAVWNDGTPITATDFIYTWIVQSGVDANITAASTTGYQNIKSVTGTDDGKTVTVVFKDDDGDTKNSFPDWKALFSPILPSHVAAKAGWDAKMTTPPKEDKGLEDSWTAFSKTMPAWSGGPFQIDPANSNPDGTKLTIIPNPKWYGTKANLDQITFVYVKDATQEPTALANGEADVIYPQPQTGLVNTIKQLDKTKFGETEKLLAEIEKAADKLSKSPPAEKDKALVELNKLTDALKDRQKQLGSTAAINKQLQQLKEMSSQGPADDFAKDLAKGDFAKAAEDVKKLQEKLAAGKMTEAEKKALQDQMAEMKQQLEKLANMEDPRRSWTTPTRTAG